MEKWNDIDFNKAVVCLQSGKTYEEIGYALNRTARSVREKLRKSGYKTTNYYDLIYKEEKKCIKCGKIIIDYKSNDRYFCSKSCSTTYNNIKKKKKVNLCLNCGKDVKNIFCNTTCRNEYYTKIVFKQIEEHTFSLKNKETESSWVKKYLIYKYGEKCMKCGWDEKNKYSNRIPIQLEHIDGDSNNNQLDNVKLLCPNCHSLTPTFGGLNRGSGRNERQKYRNSIKLLTIDELILEKEKLEIKL